MKKLMLLSVILLGSQVCWGMSDADYDLRSAVRTGDLRLLEDALVAGADVNVSDRSGHVALELATALALQGKDKEVKILKRLLEAGADVNLGPDAESTALGLARLPAFDPYVASLSSDEEIATAKKIVRLLEEYDPSLNSDE